MMELSETAGENTKTRLDELVTRKIPLCDRVGNAQVEHDFSLDYASFLSLHPDLVNTRAERTKFGGITYYIKGGGTVELRHEITGIGKVVVYFNECPKHIYDELNSLERRVVEQANKLYPV